MCSITFLILLLSICFHSKTSLGLAGSCHVAVCSYDLFVCGWTEGGTLYGVSSYNKDTDPIGSGPHLSTPPPLFLTSFKLSYFLKALSPNRAPPYEFRGGDVCVWRTHAKLLQLHPTLYDPMGHSPLGSSVHGILQARILEFAGNTIQSVVVIVKLLELTSAIFLFVFCLYPLVLIRFVLSSCGLSIIYSFCSGCSGYTHTYMYSVFWYQHFTTLSKVWIT